MFVDNKYTKWYFSIIQTAKTITRSIYTESHHIIPRSMGGTDDPSNLVKLSAREHFVCHKLLVKMVTGKKNYHKMLCAVAYFSNNTNRKLHFSSRDIEYLREANAIASSARNKGNQYWLNRAPDSPELKMLKSKNAAASKWVNNGVIERFTKEYDYFISIGYTLGRKSFSTETLSNMKAAGKRSVGVKRSEDFCRKVSEGNKGKSKPQSHRDQLSAARKSDPDITCEYCGKVTKPINYKKWHGAKCASINARPVYVCEHCNKTCTNIANYKRWHSDNCKLNVNSQNK